MRWFKHQSDARNSLKLRKVRRKYGANGYAIYWFCLEAIAYEVDKDNLTFDLKEDAETIAFELSIQESLVQEIMKYMVNIGLFESSTGVITCLKLAESIDKSMTNSPRMRAWLDTKNVMTPPDSLMTSTDTANACAELDKIRLDKNKDSTNQDSIERDLAKKEASKAKDNLLESTFDHWWQDYPRKDTKKKARSIWATINKTNDKEKVIALAELISEDINIKLEDLKAGNDRHFGFDRLLPTSYLNGERWNDDK